MRAETSKGKSPGPESDSGERSREHTQQIEQLFRDHNEALIRFLLTRLRSRQEATEVAQEAYVRLLNLDEPGAVSYLRAFLFKTAANLAVDRMRRSEVHDRATGSPFFAELTDARTPERRVAASQTLHRLERLIAGMPGKRRQAFVLRCVQGMDGAAVAAELGLSARMVRQYVAEALLQCRASLDLELPAQDVEGNEHD
jgi:RNA polymerase sigma-70 factor (ECF subfamily)